MPELKNIKEYIRALEHITGFFRALLEEENKITPPPSTDIEYLSELTDLRWMLKSDPWPLAVEPELLEKETVEEKWDRATSIIRDYMQVNMSGRRFLDYGCGEGYVARKAVDLGAEYSVGYDIKTNPAWSSFTPASNFAVTTQLQDNEFDVILMNDVLDHVESPVSVLNHARIAKKSEGRIFVRCHPWTSRHGTHLYKTLNKAYMQLVFTDQELIGMGLLGEKVARPLDPIATYKKWFNEAGLRVTVESTVTQSVEAFFTTKPKLIRRIKDNWKESTDPELAAGTKFPHSIMEIQFADFVLK